MSGISSQEIEVATPPFKKPKGVEESSDNKLREENDKFWLSRIIKFFILILVISGGALCFVVFAKEILFNRVFQIKVLDQIAQNIGILIISGFSILGINFAKNI